MLARRVAALGGLSAAFVLLASCLSVLVARSTNVASPQAMVETAAPDFTLKDTDGKSVNLRGLRGKVVVLMFTDPRCPVSNEYNGRIMDLVGRYKDQPVVFLAIATGRRVDEPGYRKELCVQRKVMGQRFPTLLDPDGRVATLFGAGVTPSFYVVGRLGMLHYAGAFDDSRDVTKVKHQHLAEAIGLVLNYGTVPVPEIPAVGTPIPR
jgi:peroxiredoxin